MATSPPPPGVRQQADRNEARDDDVKMESVEPNADNVEMTEEMADAADKGANAQEDASDDDPVVQEYDVYLNRMFDPPFGGDMYVLQYPLRPYYRPYEDQGTLERVELKPQARRLQYVYKLYENDNYDRNDISAERMKNHVLTSTVVANPACSYAVGIIHNGRMVVAPIHAVNQLRPDFEHMDKAEENRQKFQETTDPEGRPGSGGEEDGPQSQASAVTVNYVAKKARVGGAVEGAPVEVFEDWEKLESYTRKEEETQDIHNNYFLWPAEDVSGKTRENDRRLQKLSLDDDKKNFLASTCMQEGEGVRRRADANAAGSSRKPPGLSSEKLNDMPVDKQVEEVVRSFGICSYSQELRRSLPLRTWRHHAHDSLIQLLKECAMLVCGKWVLKSELSGFDGFARIARDMLLNLLNTKNGVLPKGMLEKWKQTFGILHPSELDAISRPLIEQVAQEAYALKYGVDNGFIKEFPDVVADFKRQWDDIRKRLPEDMEREKYRQRTLGGKGGGNLTPRSQQLSVATADDRDRRRKLLKEIALALKQKGMTLAQLRKFIQPKFKDARIEEREIEDILRTRDVKAIQVGHLWVAERVYNVLHDKFRMAVHSVFRQRVSATKQEIIEAFEEAENSPCTLTDFCVRYYIREVADRASETEDTWVLRESL